MTQTAQLPDLTITARAAWTVDDAGRGWVVTYEFDGFPAGRYDDVVAKLVAHWQMTPEVAESVASDLWMEATREDGNDTAEVTLTADPDAAFEADPS